jgi:ABC-type antimicrobial peptide transport system permease subunit
MPPGFGFPRNQELWIPLRVDPTIGPLEGPGVIVFGRLAPGSTFQHARTELGTFVARRRVDRPDAYDHLHARVLPYAEAASGITELRERLGIMSINVFAGLFLVLVCGNVALLMFTRAAAREGAIVVRTALGASRRRIVWQLFSKALVLGTVAGVVLGAKAIQGRTFNAAGIESVT